MNSQYRKVCSHWEYLWVLLDIIVAIAPTDFTKLWDLCYYNSQSEHVGVKLRCMHELYVAHPSGSPGKKVCLHCGVFWLGVRCYSKKAPFANIKADQFCTHVPQGNRTVSTSAQRIPSGAVKMNGWKLRAELKTPKITSKNNIDEIKVGKILLSR